MYHPTTNGNIKTAASSQGCDAWYYPPDIANDLKDVNLPDEVKCEIFACAWEYARCVIPQYTNWDRYIAFMRIIVMGTIAEFKGSMVDVTAGDMILGYSLSSTLATLFEGTPCHADMAREYRTFLLITADKASNRRDSELFRRYVNSLAHSPKQWFRMRDCDALARFTIAGCSGGETNSTFAYMPEDLRVKAFRQCREVLWALDVAWAHQRKMQVVNNFVRFFGGPIHMMMRRYRFVEEDLTIGKPETNQVITQTRVNFKLWNRVDANKMKDDSEEDIQRYKDVLARSEELMFRGLDELLETGGDGVCDTCRYRASYGAETTHRFGGVELCAGCRAKWRGFLESFPDRATQVFPELMKTKASCGQYMFIYDYFERV
ncbi:hypothetical protein DFH08DRAFT_925648 [Mycena albidolilacea]|uniref:ABA 3 protein n=1 Tax=Mycena albidolilacea TaxID=1033008 RepID=A0AAD6ZQI3_9AGAR|nr:hypothetical protein DFH08DRAFT_925648 [Mycena albidolilacea]